MSFLLGAFGKLAAGRRVRDLQSRMMRVQSRLRRATRQVETMSKMIESQKKMELNSLSMMASNANSMTGFVVGGQLGLNQSQIAMLMGGMGMSGLNNSEALQNAGITSEMASNFNYAIQQMKSGNEASLAQMKMVIEEKYENMTESMLEPLKQEQDSLQTEKDSLESQLQIANADYEACKQMEKADAKNLAPNYTGQ